MTTKKNPTDPYDELEARMNADAERGCIGARTDPDDSLAHSLQSGPSSPQLPDDRTQVRQPPYGDPYGQIPQTSL